MVRVIADPPVPLREKARMNDSGFPVWGIFGKSVSSNRIKINQAGKLVAVWEEKQKGDGGNYAYEDSKIFTGKNNATLFYYASSKLTTIAGTFRVNHDLSKYFDTGVTCIHSPDLYGK